MAQKFGLLASRGARSTVSFSENSAFSYTEVMKALLSRFLSQFATGCKNSVNVR